MAGIKLAVQGAPEVVLSTTAQAAQSMGFAVASLSPQSLSLKKGSLGLSFILGAFIAYCDFRAHVHILGDGVVQLTLERNTPWWTGVIGVSRVKTRAKELVDAVHRGLSTQGLNVTGRADF